MKYLGQRISFYQQETTEIKSRIRAAWATFHKYRQELTSKNYMLEHRLRLFDATVSPTVCYAAGTWASNKEHERMIQLTQRKMLRLIIQTKKKYKKIEKQDIGPKEENVKVDITEMCSSDQDSDEERVTQGLPQLCHLQRQKARGREAVEVRVPGVRKLRKMIERSNTLSPLGQGHTSSNQVSLMRRPCMLFWKVEETHDRTEQPVVCPQRGAMPQQIIIADDEAEMELSLRSRSFLNRVNDQVRKRQKRSSMNVTENDEKHSVIWRMFMSVTLESAIFMGKNYSDNQHSIKNTKDLTMKQSSTNLQNWCLNKMRSISICL